MVRLQKYLADAGKASRRAAEKLILEGRVSVNGRVVRELGTRVNPQEDEVSLDQVPVKPLRKTYLALHKPADYVCTRSDPEKRKIVMDLLPENKRHVHPVGRLDRGSEGLLFLTNDGDFSLRITHPRYQVSKVYHATIAGRATLSTLADLKKGVRDRGDRLFAREAILLGANNTRSHLEITLTEGKNREVRRLFAALGFKVLRLIRIRIGPVSLGELPSGKWRTLTESEINSLLAP